MEKTRSSLKRCLSSETKENLFIDEYDYGQRVQSPFEKLLREKNVISTVEVIFGSQLEDVFDIFFRASDNPQNNLYSIGYKSWYVLSMFNLNEKDIKSFYTQPLLKKIPNFHEFLLVSKKVVPANRLQELFCICGDRVNELSFLMERQKKEQISSRTKMDNRTSVYQITPLPSHSQNPRLGEMIHKTLSVPLPPPLCAPSASARGTMPNPQPFTIPIISLKSNPSSSPSPSPTNLPPPPPPRTPHSTTNNNSNNNSSGGNNNGGNSSSSNNNNLQFTQNTTSPTIDAYMGGMMLSQTSDRNKTLPKNFFNKRFGAEEMNAFLQQVGADPAFASLPTIPQTTRNFINLPISSNSHTPPPSLPTAHLPPPVFAHLSISPRDASSQFTASKEASPTSPSPSSTSSSSSTMSGNEKKSRKNSHVVSTAAFAKLIGKKEKKEKKEERERERERGGREGLSYSHPSSVASPTSSPITTTTTTATTGVNTSSAHVTSSPTSPNFGVGVRFSSGDAEEKDHRDRSSSPEERRKKPKTPNFSKSKSKSSSPSSSSSDHHHRHNDESEIRIHNLVKKNPFVVTWDDVQPPSSSSSSSSSSSDHNNDIRHDNGGDEDEDLKSSSSSPSSSVLLLSSSGGVEGKLNNDSSSFVINMESYLYEVGDVDYQKYGEDWVSYTSLTSVENAHKDIPFYRNHFYSKNHHIYGSKDPNPSFICISHPSKDTPTYITVFHPQETYKLSAPPDVKVKEVLKELQNFIPEISELTYYKLKSFLCEESLLTFESNFINLTYKFGILYCAADQTQENDMFANVEGSEDYKEFLDFIGTEINLLGWEKFKGGLDVTSNKTGSKSIYTTFRNYEIMFHVSTLLPYFPADEQQLERKRHIGNDAVILIFKEGDQRFDPSCIHSDFVHMFLIVQKVILPDSDQTHYRVELSCKKGVPRPPLPLLPSPPIFKKDDKFKNFILSKLINSERAAMESAKFGVKLGKARLNSLSFAASQNIKEKTRERSTSFG